MKININTKTYFRYLYLLILFMIPIGLVTGSDTLGNQPKAFVEATSHLDSITESTVSEAISDSVKKREPSEVVIVVDPGHGGTETGAIYGKLQEKNINLDMALRYGKLLETEGLKVIYTRKTDKNVELKDRAQIANSINATLFISVHNNDLPGNSDYRGSETLYAKSYKAGENDKPINGEKLATIVQRELVNTLKTVDNGTIFRPNLAVLRRTSMPAVIAEIGYMSNPKEKANLMANEFRDKTAQALKNATMKALEKMKATKDANGKWKI